MLLSLAEIEGIICFFFIDIDVFAYFKIVYDGVVSASFLRGTIESTEQPGIRVVHDLICFSASFAGFAGGSQPKLLQPHWIRPHAFERHVGAVSEPGDSFQQARGGVPGVHPLHPLPPTRLSLPRGGFTQSMQLRQLRSPRPLPTGREAERRYCRLG